MNRSNSKTFSEKGSGAPPAMEHTSSYSSTRRGRRGSLMESASQFGYYGMAVQNQDSASKTKNDLPVGTTAPLAKNNASSSPNVQRKAMASINSINNSKVFDGSTVNESLQFSSMEDSSSVMERNRLGLSSSQT